NRLLSLHEPFGRLHHPLGLRCQVAGLRFCQKQGVACISLLVANVRHLHCASAVAEGTVRLSEEIVAASEGAISLPVDTARIVAAASRSSRKSAAPAPSSARTLATRNASPNAAITPASVA